MKWLSCQALVLLLMEFQIDTHTRSPQTWGTLAPSRCWGASVGVNHSVHSCSDNYARLAKHQVLEHLRFCMDWNEICQVGGAEDSWQHAELRKVQWDSVLMARDTSNRKAWGVWINMVKSWQLIPKKNVGDLFHAGSNTLVVHCHSVCREPHTSACTQICICTLITLRRC